MDSTIWGWHVRDSMVIGNERRDLSLSGLSWDLGTENANKRIFKIYYVKVVLTLIPEIFHHERRQLKALKIWFAVMIHAAAEENQILNN